MDDKPLLPGQWIDNLNWDALHTVADVEDVMRKVASFRKCGSSKNCAQGRITATI